MGALLNSRRRETMHYLHEHSRPNHVIPVAVDRASPFEKKQVDPFERVAQGRVPPNPGHEDTRTLGRVVLTTATAIGGMMGLVTYWIG